MKKLFVFAAAFGLFASVPAPAQNNDRHDDQADASRTDHSSMSGVTHRKDQGHATARQDDHAMRGDRHNAPAVQATGRNGPAAASRVRNTGFHQADPMAGTAANPYLPTSGDVRSSSPNRAASDRARNTNGWSGNTAQRQSDLRRNMRATRHFHGGSYSGPHGYQYRHWSYGERLPRGYFVRNYWIADFVTYDLFAPPPDLVWVRVGDDALLIDRESGDIVQVRYGVFY